MKLRLFETYTALVILKNGETFEKKFKKHSNLADDLDNETENFIKIAWYTKMMFLSESMELISTLAALLTDT